MLLALVSMPRELTMKPVVSQLQPHGAETDSRAMAV